MVLDDSNLKITPEIKNYYSEILCQVISPCGNFLAAGNIFGEIIVFDLRIVLNPPEDNIEVARKPSLTFQLPIKRAAFSLASTDRFLIVGSCGEVIGFDWKAITLGKTPKVAWMWDLPSVKNDMESIEANAIVVLEDGNAYIACGDNNIHAFSLEDGRLVKTLTGHEGYLHDVCKTDENQLASCSEDGTVRLWDVRTKAARAIIEPYKQSELERQSLGKWVGSIYVDKEWLLCGGGVRAGLFHIPTTQLTSSFNTEDSGIHVTRIQDDRVFVGGRYKLCQFSLTGEDVGSVTCSSNTLMSLVYSEKPHRVMSLAGTTRYLDLCTSFNCRDQVLDCC